MSDLEKRVAKRTRERLKHPASCACVRCEDFCQAIVAAVRADLREKVEAVPCGNHRLPSGYRADVLALLTTQPAAPAGGERCGYVYFADTSSPVVCNGTKGAHNQSMVYGHPFQPATTCARCGGTGEAPMLGDVCDVCGGTGGRK